MRALVLHEANVPLELVELADPKPEGDQVLVRVSVCGVCRTDLDIVEGRIIPPRYPVVPGHQIIGRIAAAGRDVTTVRAGDRVGVAWIHWACGVCRWCRAGDENLCPYFRSTGCDANGGYAEFVVAPATFVHAIPDIFTDEHAAPLLCAGAIGWRALRLANVQPGDPLGLSGFGASAHLVLQLARHKYPDSPIFVFARSEQERAFARELGAQWTGDFEDSPPRSLGAVIDTTPAWKPVVDTLPHLMPGGRLVINAIRKAPGDKNEVLRLEYETHLWMEREIKSVANVTRADVREMLAAAAAIGLEPTVHVVPLERANEVLSQMSRGAPVRGAGVLQVGNAAP